MARIRIENLSKHYAGADGPAALHGLSLDIADNRFVTLLGPSGCGKTTTLRLIAGYMRPDSGSIKVDERLLSSPDGVVPPESRGMGMVFQNYAVWPHKTVFENVAFGLQVRRTAASEIAIRVAKMLEQVGLAGYEKRLPSELSGGQQQRVALARSLVVEPAILLLDEPLSNLDAKLRERMRVELKQLQRRTGITFVYVTHDQAEALALSDDIAVMHQGKLQQFGPPREIYARPANRVVADFMGQVNFIPGHIVNASDGMALVTVVGGLSMSLDCPAALRAGTDVDIAVRPENLRLSSSAGDFTGRVAEVTYLGNQAEYVVAAGDLRLRVQTHPTQVFASGDVVAVEFDPALCTMFARASTPHPNPPPQGGRE
jgi:iron(III) transport system ATP-binding protein